MSGGCQGKALGTQKGVWEGRGIFVFGKQAGVWDQILIPVPPLAVLLSHLLESIDGPHWSGQHYLFSA